MSYCPRCGKQLPVDATACPSCNAQVYPNSAEERSPAAPGDHKLKGKSSPEQQPSEPPRGAYAPLPQRPSTSGMAIASMVLGILGVISFGYLGILGVIGLILGIVAISKINKSEGQISGKGMAIAGVVTGSISTLLFIIVLIGIIAALAIPNFIKMQAKSKQSEAKTNLAVIFTFQVVYHGENNTYADSFDKIGWEPEGQNLYTYYLADDSIPSKKGPVYDLPYDVQTKVEQREFIAVAVGNIDVDETLDVWTIDDEKRFRNVQDDTTH